MSFIKKVKLNNALVVCFQMNGCMASEHDFQWIGKVVSFEQTRYAGLAAKVQVFKRQGTPSDIRDESMAKALGYELAIVADASLQQIGSKLFFYYR